MDDRVDDAELLDETVGELSVDEVTNVLDVDADGAAVTLYSDSPFGPPQICDLSAAHGILQRPSLAGAEPATRLLPQ